MKYAKFERIVVLIIAVAIAVMAVAMIVQKTDGVEVLGHALMLAVIVCSLYWGKRGALAGFAASFSAYTAARLIWPGDFGAATLVQLIAAKLIVYGVLALLCSHVRTQFRYFFVKMEHQDLIDDETQVGNERFLLRELTSRINENERYEIPFSLVSFQLDGDFVSGLKKDRGVSVLRDISTSILKNDTRSVDELAREGNNLLVILPSVGLAGAQVCGRRLEAKLRRYLEQHLPDGDADRVMQSAVYEYPDNKAEIDTLVERLSAAGDG